MALAKLCLKCRHGMNVTLAKPQRLSASIDRLANIEPKLDANDMAR